MEEKYVKAIILLLSATCGGVVAACVSKYARDVFFFLLVTFSAVATEYDVNFVSRAWYRGTTNGFEVSLVDVFAISLVVSSFLFPRPGEKRFYWPASLGWMLLLFIFAIGCTAICEPKLFAYFALTKMVRGLLVFLAAALYIRSEREIKLFVLALAAGAFYEGYVAISQRYLYGIHRVFGTLDAPNSLSMYFNLTAPVFVAALTSRLPKYLKAVCAATVAISFLGVVLTISRTGIVTIALIMLAATLATMSWSINLRKIVIAIVVAAGVSAVIAKSWQTLVSRFSEATVAEEANAGRGSYFKIAGAIMEDQWFGVGPNNWSYWVSNRYGPRLGYKYAPYVGVDKQPRFIVSEDARVDDPQAAPAHNLGALTVGEMGIGGLLIFAILWLRWFQMGAVFLWPRLEDPLRRIAVGIFFGTWGIFLQSLTEWVYHQTPIFFTFNIMLGALASMYYIRKRERKARIRAEREEEEAYWAAQTERAAC